MLYQLSYSRTASIFSFKRLTKHKQNNNLVEGVGLEPTKEIPADLQSAPVDRLGTPPQTSLS
jgi:hypothetical protein